MQQTESSYLWDTRVLQIKFQEPIYYIFKLINTSM